MTPKPLTFGSLFAGIGGFDLGFERAGMECKWQVEIDPYCQKVLAKHWPNVRRHDDVRTFPPAGDWSVDVICGGFPCQDISYAGKGAGLAGERSGLFYEAMRIVREVGPRIVVLENVAALLTRGLDQVLGTLASLGFDAEWHCVSAAHVGAPHIRDRAFIVAYATSGGWDVRTTTQHGRDSGISRSQRKSEAVEAGGGRCHASNANSKGLEKRQGQDSGGAWSDCWPKPGRSEWWKSEPALGRVAHGVPSRVDRLRGLGNAVVPQVAEWIGRRLMESNNAPSPLTPE